MADTFRQGPHRSVKEEVLSKGEIQTVLEDIRVTENWFYPCFAVWLGTGLRNAELIGLTWDCVRLEEGELLITKTLRRDGVATHRREWSGTKTGKSRVVPLREDLVVLLQEHKEQMGSLGLDTQKGLVFVTPKTYGHLYDSRLERVWKRSQSRVGIEAPPPLRPTLQLPVSRLGDGKLTSRPGRSGRSLHQDAAE